MKKYFLHSTITYCFLLLFMQVGFSQCLYQSAAAGSDSAVTFTLTGGSVQSYGCAPIDPNYWVSGNGPIMVATFTTPQINPSFRVWGMNDDDSASVLVNGVAYPLNAVSASYDAKETCGLSPGPDGVKFANGMLTGANSNTAGNYSFQNITIHASLVTSITLKCISGAGWGYVGVSYDCANTLSVIDEGSAITGLYPNPTTGNVTIAEPGILNADVTIVNELGMCAKKIKLTTNTFNIADLSPGIYFVVIEMNNQSITKRLIKL